MQAQPHKPLPVFDKKRMEKALAAKKIQVPPGLTREEKRAFIKAHAK